MQVTFNVQRFDPEQDDEPYLQEFVLDVEPTDRILDALHQIKDHHDGSLAFRRSCGHGVCGSDAMLINKVNRLACRELVRNFGRRITIEPLRGYDVLKDLMVDMEPFFEQYKKVKPWFMNSRSLPPGEQRQSPAERQRFDDTTKCILCAACTTACPIFWSNEEYVGPAAIVQAHRFIFDSRDDGAQERLDILNGNEGVWRCRTAFNCTDACPRGIEVTRAIQEVKRHLLVQGD